MKTLIFFFTLLGMLSAFAGEIISKSGESISLKLNSNDQTVEISDNLGRVKKIKLNQSELADELKSDVELCAASNYVTEEIYTPTAPGTQTQDMLLSILVPIYNIPRLGGIAYDVLLFPFKSASKTDSKYES